MYFLSLLNYIYYEKLYIYPIFAICSTYITFLFYYFLSLEMYIFYYSSFTTTNSDSSSIT